MKANMSKTTVEIDEAKLDRIMASMGIKTRKEAIDWALTEAEKIAVMNHIAAHPWDAATIKESVYPAYDILSIRRQKVTYDKPKRTKK